MRICRVFTSVMRICKPHAICKLYAYLQARCVLARSMRICKLYAPLQALCVFAGPLRFRRLCTGSMRICLLYAYLQALDVFASPMRICRRFAYLQALCVFAGPIRICKPYARGHTKTNVCSVFSPRSHTNNNPGTFIFCKNSIENQE